MEKIKEKKNNLHAGHRSRMRARFAKDGFDSFSDHECMEYLLYHTMKRVNTNETAHKLINRFGSIKGVLDAPYEELIKVDGVGDVTARYITGLNSQIAALITEQFKEIGRFNDMNAAVLADWVMKIPENMGKTLVYECDDKGRIGNLCLAGTFDLKGGGFDIRTFVDRIIDKGAGSYIVFLNDALSLTSEAAKGIASYTKLFGAEILEIYFMNGQRPVTLLKNNK